MKRSATPPPPQQQEQHQQQLSPPKDESNKQAKHNTTTTTTTTTTTNITEEEEDQQQQQQQKENNTTTPAYTTTTTATSDRTLLTKDNNTLTATTTTKPTSKDTTPYALYTKVGDNFLFTSAKELNAADAENLNLGSAVNLIKLVPYAAKEETARTLQETIPLQPKPPLQQRLPLPNQEVIPAEFLNYGPYSSFAPAINTYSSTLTAEETLKAQISKKNDAEISSNSATHDAKKTVEKVDASVDATSVSKIPEIENHPDMDVDLDFDALLADGIDLDSMLEYAGAGQDRSPSGVDGILKENTLHFAELQRLQNKRMNSEKPEQIQIEEKHLSAKLANGLSSLIALTQPSKLVKPGSAESAMDTIPRYDASFRGTLPIAKPLAYPNMPAPQPSTPSVPSTASQQHAASSQPFLPQNAPVSSYPVLSRPIPYPSYASYAGSAYPASTAAYSPYGVPSYPHYSTTPYAPSSVVAPATPYAASATAPSPYAVSNAPLYHPAYATPSQQSHYTYPQPNSAISHLAYASSPLGRPLFQGLPTVLPSTYAVNAGNVSNVGYGGNGAYGTPSRAL